MRWAVLVAVIAASSVAQAAPRKPYGGEVTAYVFGAPVTLAPGSLDSSADLAVQRALYERLYRLDADGDLVPELAAGAPKIEGRTVVVPIRSDAVLHDGRPLTADMVAESLRRLVTDRTQGAYVGAFVVGAAGQFEGKNLPVGIRARGQELRFDLDAAHDGFARVLASAHAAIMVPATGRAGALGTGPFRFGGRGAKNTITLEPFLEHREGRPFLDRVVFKPHASRFGAASMARGRQAFVFGVPDAKSAEAIETAWPARSVKPPIETLLLAIGPKVGSADRREALRAAIDGALNRGRLASRFLGADAIVTRRLLDFESRRAPRAERPDPGTFTMLVARDGRAGHRFAERVQLDLLRVGITVKIERVWRSRLVERRRSGTYELLVDTVRSGVAHSPNEFDRLHALMSIAAAFGAPGVIDRAARVDVLSAGNGQRRAALDELESSLRRDLALVPIARRTAAVVATPNVSGLELAPDGAVELGNAHRAR